MLERPELRQLAQRITARYHLTPLDEDETEAFTRHRLAVAGSPRFPFTRLGVRALHARAGGVPRLINIIAERALMAGYVADEPQIGERLVNHAADEVIGRNRRRRRRYVAAAAIVAALGFTALWAARQPPPAPAPPPVPEVPAAPGMPHDELAARVGTLPADANLAAWTQLLALWQVDPQRLTVRDAARCPADIYPGLSCLRLSGNVAKLRALERPVLLQLHVGERHPLAVLRGLGSTTARLDFGVPTVRDDAASAVVELPLALLDQVWLGEFYAIWKSQQGLPETIRRGDVGAPAAWLRERLARFEALAPAELVGPPVVDSQLEARVRAVQSRFGLAPDGIVGPETELALTSRDPAGPVLARDLP